MINHPVGWLIGVSIVLQVICATVSGGLAVTARSGPWRFWPALTVAFLAIVLRRSIWLLDEMMGLSRELARWASVAATCLVSFAFLAAMAEAAIFHRGQRRQIASLSDNIIQLERRLEERERGRVPGTSPSAA